MRYLNISLNIFRYLPKTVNLNSFFESNEIMGRRKKNASPSSDLPLPATKSLSSIEVNNCQSLNVLNAPEELRQSKNGFTRMIEGKQCNAIFKGKQKKYFINKKSQRGTVEKARVFCDRIRNPRLDPDFEHKRDDLKLYYEHNEVWEYEGREGYPCKITMKIRTPSDQEKVVSYDSEYITINKPKK